MNTDRTSPLIVAKNMAALRTRQGAIAQCKRHMATPCTDFDFWREVADHLENTNFD